MKKIDIIPKFILIFVFFLMTYMSYAQSYEPVLKLGRGWGVEFTSTSGSSPAVTSTEYILIDTVHIDSNVYFVPEYQITVDSLIFREDSVEKRVYVYDITQHEEYIVYDFSLEEGDSVPDNFVCLDRYGYYEQAIGAVVTTIDSVELLDGNKRKRIYVESNNNIECDLMYMIEGIGGAMGYISSGNSYTNLSMNLLCVKDNNNLIYGECDILSIEEQNHVNIGVYPNPFNNQINISSSLPIFMYVYNALGKEIYHSPTLVLTHSLNTENYPQGMYLIKGVNENGVEVFSEKIVKE